MEKPALLYIVPLSGLTLQTTLSGEWHDCASDGYAQGFGTLGMPTLYRVVDQVDRQEGAEPVDFDVLFLYENDREGEWEPSIHLKRRDDAFFLHAGQGCVRGGFLDGDEFTVEFFDG